MIPNISEFSDFQLQATLACLEAKELEGTWRNPDNEEEMYQILLAIRLELIDRGLNPEDPYTDINFDPTPHDNDPGFCY